MLDLTGKVAIVAGAGSVAPGWGNGRATAVLLARQGAAVFLVDLDAAAAEATASIIEGEGGSCAVHRCDATDLASVEQMVQACVNRFGRIDILVNNVGGSEPGDAVSMPEATWDRQIDFNLKTAFLGCKYALPVMGRRAAARSSTSPRSPGCATSPQRAPHWSPTAHRRPG